MGDDVDIEAKVREYLLREFFPDEGPDVIDDSTKLLSDGYLDSIGVSTLVSFLAEEYGVEFAAHELDDDHLDTVPGIAELVRRKIAARG